MPYKIAIVTKKSAYQLALEHKNKAILALIKSEDKATANYLSAHRANEEAKRALMVALRPLARKAKISFYDRANVKNLSNKSLVITLGGDGTFLWASRYVSKDTPIIGLNADPTTSVGFFTIGSKENFSQVAQLVKAFIEGHELETQALTRMQVELNGKVIAKRVLNDVFYGAAHPAAMTRYFLSTDNNTEEQKSGGMWISTPAGSTGGNLSAGGQKMPLESTKLQWVTREPMKNWMDCEDLFENKTGFFEKLVVKNKTRSAILAIDGTTTTKKITIGDEIIFTKSDDFLTKVRTL